MPHHKVINTLLFIKSTKADPDSIPSRKSVLEKHCVPILTALLKEQSNFEQPAKLCEYVVNFLRNSPKQLVEIAKQIISGGLADDAKLIFQPGNLVTELLTTILFRYTYHQISPLIKTTLKQLIKISKLNDLTLQIEVDEPEVILNKVEKLAKLVKTFFASLSNIKWTTEVLVLLKFLHEYMENKYKMGNYTVTYFLFVPFVCQIIKNSYYYNLLAKQKFDNFQSSLHLFCDLILNVVNNIEFKDSQSYLSCLNCIIRRHSSQWGNIVKNILENAENKIFDSDVNSKKNPNEITKVSMDKEYLPMIELYLSLYEQQIMYLHFYGKDETIFNDFLASCSPEIQEKIANYNFPKDSKDICDLKFLEIIFDFFNSKNLQDFSIIKKIPVLKHRIYLINKVAALESQEIRGKDIDTIDLCLNGSCAAFPMYEEKLKSFIDFLRNESIDPSSDNAFAILIKLYEFKVNPNSYTVKQRGSLPSIIYQSNNMTQYDFSSTEYLLSLLCDWGLDALIAQELVPTVIFDKNSLLNFDTSLLKELKISMGTRKTVQRKLNELKSIIETEVSFFEMNLDQTCEWLTSIGFDMYVPVFKDARISGKDLQTFSVDSLKGMGITLLGHRKKIMREISRAAHPPVESESDPHLSRRNSNPMLYSPVLKMLNRKKSITYEIRRRGSSPLLSL